MKLVVIIGDAAVGKMTVGQELMKITDLRLFHNHMTIEPIIEIFGYFDKKTIFRWRQAVFEEFAKSSNYGMIFTYMWAFDQPSDWAYIQDVCDLFAKEGAELYFVELIADRKERFRRNETENRLKHKASKRNLTWSRARVEEDSSKYRLVSLDGEIPYPNYIKIDNTHLQPDVVAKQIKDHFKL